MKQQLAPHTVTGCNTNTRWQGVLGQDGKVGVGIVPNGETMIGT